MRELLPAAVRDNARWCGLVAASHGIAARTDDDAWTTSRRTPPGYPDAVTLRPGVDPERLLARLDTTSPGCSVKDSFADLDLSPYGFRELFAARWIAHPNRADRADDADGADLRRDPASGPRTPRWARVTDAHGLSVWLAARGDTGDPVLLPALLADPDVTVLAATLGDDVVAGGILTTGGWSVVGASNVFAASAEDPWAGVLAWARVHHRGRPLVGYESGDDLDAAVRHGFATTGPLRVWMALDADPPVADLAPAR